ncbi:polysaccharide biosynthesis/export family protein [Bythopirellula goksoeyrii]|uniref:Polysaccharide biosynthesis/export protein n=1 Tax=Bythopirellula goksoeyrii TaxID=1400387 RepID=A0A5B9Q448_9BACT|nr:polysaccharide biosynthesis/export family protein [Bythopirellula goksoeyrii]QEG33757.1 Polysaccharide biosynthesis/export protein [Bythopirellula goksoeyrii]
MILSNSRQTGLAKTLAVFAVLLGSSGCTAFLAPRDPFPATPPEPPIESSVPRELEKVTLPRYVIEPPDILLVEGVKLVPKSPHKIETFDALLVRVSGAFPDKPIDDAYSVDADGSINLGPAYGRIKVTGLTLEEAEDEVRRQLSQILTDVDVSISLLQSAGAQAVTGQHLVGPDGRVNLGTYGSAFVAGMTIEEAKAAIEEQLSLKLESPEVFVDVLAYNSKLYYVITQGGGFGDDVTRLPITGNETVLDAVASIGGISQVSSSRMWIARPAPNGVGCEQILPVNWEDISRGAATATNYQLMPGDRLFIAQDRYTAGTATVAKILRPFESIFGFMSLSTSALNQIARFGLSNFSN